MNLSNKERAVNVSVTIKNCIKQVEHFLKKTKLRHRVGLPGVVWQMRSGRVTEVPI